MDNQDEALNQTVETETTETASPAVETTEATEVDVSTPVVEEEPKKGAQSRIRELNSKVHSLTDRIAELTNPVGSSVPETQYRPQQVATSEDDSIDPQEFKRQVLHEANQMISFETQRARTLDRINRETEQVVGKFKELDPDSDIFDKDISDALYEAVEAKIKSDPTASVTQFVEKQMKVFRREASKEETQTKATVDKQAAQSAIRPSVTKPVEKGFSELTIQQMREKLGYAQ